MEYAIEVVLSDESRYTIYRTLKEVATLNVSVYDTIVVSGVK